MEEIKRGNLLQKILGNNDFQYDEFFNSLPKDIWNFIFSFFEKKDMNKILLISKSFYYFLNLNPPDCWKSLSFRYDVLFSKAHCYDCISLVRFSRLTKLFFSSWNIKGELLTYIFNIHKYLFKIKFHFCLLEDKELKVIIKWMKAHQTLKTLDLQWNNISLEGFQDLCNGIGITKSIEKFKFAGDMKIEKITILANLLKTNLPLKVLWILSTIRPKELKIIFESLNDNKNLKKLTLLGKVESDGVRYIVDTLRINTNLLHLDIEIDHIGDIEINYIVEALKTNTTLKTLVIRYSIPTISKKGQIFQQPEPRMRIFC